MDENIIIEYLASKNYIIVESLGSGSFGIVYKVQNTITLQINVIKITDELDTYNIEIKNLNYLKTYCNKYFLCLSDTFKINLLYFIVFEYLENYVDLFYFIYNTQISNIYNTIIINLIDGIIFMLKIKYVHFDIKPENIMVNYLTGDIRFIDFGGGCFDLSICESIKKFTPVFYSPTLYNNTNPLTMEMYFANDRWAIGIVIYEMLLKAIPYYQYKNEYKYFKNYKFKSDKNRDIIKNIIEINKFDFTIKLLDMLLP